MVSGGCKQLRHEARSGSLGELVLDIGGSRGDQVEVHAVVITVLSVEHRSVTHTLTAAS